MRIDMSLSPTCHRPWNTACSAAPPNLTGSEVETLQDHLKQCARQHNAGHLWHCVSRDLLTLATARLLTTSVLGLLLVRTIQLF